MSARGHGLLNPAIIGASILLFAIAVIILLGAHITGFAALSWENSKEISVNNTEKIITEHLVFGQYKPANCTDGILIEVKDDLIQTISFETSNEIYDEQNLCTETDVTFENIIYNENEVENLTFITYVIKWGKVEVQTPDLTEIEEENGAVIESEVTEALKEKEEVPVAIVIEEKKASEIKAAKSDVVAALSDTNAELQYFPEAQAYAAELDEEEIKQLEPIEGIKVEAQKEFHIDLSASVPYIGATNVWPISVSGTNITGKNVTVCVVDTGIDYTHTALGGCIGVGCKVLGGYDYVNSDDNPIDDNSHGTHAAGIIASSDGTYKGVAPEASLIAMKSFDATGYAPSQNIANGIKWCVDNSATYNIKIISMSFGDGSVYNSTSCPNDTLIDPQLDAAHSAGILLVASSGNSHGTTGVTYPACHSDVIAVGATGRDDDNIQSFSNSGENLDMLAPGASITSTVLSNGFGSMSGTSMAAPHISGAAALLIQYIKLKEGRTLMPGQAEDRLEDSGKLVNDTRNGIVRPRVNILAAIAPIINIESPLNQTYTNGSIVYSINVENTLEVYAVEANVSIDGTEYALTNDTPTHWFNDGITTLGGLHIATFKVKDNLGDTNDAFVLFGVDLSPPTITLISPANNSNISAGQLIDLNVTDDVSLANAWYILNSVNTQLLAPFDINTINWSKAQHNIAVFANDSLGNNASQGYSFTVTNTAPTILNMTTDKIPTKSDTVTCNATASDAENDPITTYYSWLNGTSVLNNAQALNCASSGCVKGLVLTCKAIPNDGKVNGTAAMFNVTVANTFPVWNMPTTSFEVDEGSQLTIDVNATDVDNDVLNYTVVNKPSSAVINSSSGVFNWTPADSDVGNKVLTFRASDGTNSTDLNISVKIDNTNNAPVLEEIEDQTAAIGVQFNLTITASDADLDSGDSLTFTDNTTLFSLNQTSNTTAQIKFTPTLAQKGNYSINISVFDESNSSDSEIFVLAVASATNYTSTNLTNTTKYFDANQTFSVISPDSPVVFKPAVTGLLVDEIVIDTKVTATNVVAKIKKLSSYSVPQPLQNTLQYFELVLDGITPDKLDKVTIKFIADKSYDPATIKLQRYDTSWQTLATTYDNETSATSDKYHFSANTAKTSVFAITGMKTAQQDTFQLTSQPKATTAAVVKDAFVKGSIVAMVIATIIVVIFVARYRTYPPKRPQQPQQYYQQPYQSPYQGQQGYQQPPDLGF